MLDKQSRGLKSCGEASAVEYKAHLKQNPFVYRMVCVAAFNCSLFAAYLLQVF